MQNRTLALTLALGAFLLAAAPFEQPLRPPDGTYVYDISGLPGLTQTTVVVKSSGATTTVVENSPISGRAAARVETTYDAGTLLPSHYLLQQGDITADVSVAGGIARLAHPPTTFHALPDTSGVVIGEGLAGYRMMLPWIARAMHAKDVTFLGIANGRLSRISAGTANDPRPAAVPVDDVEVALADSSGVRLTFWVNEATHVVDEMGVASIAFHLAQPASPVAAPTPTPLPSR